MKTTSEQLLARAEELEARARALRIAAAEMNGHQTAEKQAKVGELFAAAGKIRKAVKIWEEPEPEKAPAPPALPPLPNKKRYKPRELAPYLARLLDGATRTTVELASLLKDQGVVTLKSGRVRDILGKLPQQFTRVGGGQGTDVRWQLKPQAKPKKKQAKWSAAQHRKFVATMKRKAAERAAAATG